MMFRGIRNTIGKGGLNDPSDIFGTKTRLKKTGDWEPLWDIYDHPSSEPLKTVETAIEGFQDRFGLKKDGFMKPGGPTETTLKAESAKQDLKDFGLPKIPDPLKIKQPVGLGQVNAVADVAPVNTALTNLAHPTLGLEPLMGTPPTLQTFQGKFGLKQDGVMLPGGPTEAKINQLAGPPLSFSENGWPRTSSDPKAVTALGAAPLHANTAADFAKAFDGEVTQSQRLERNHVDAINVASPESIDSQKTQSKKCQQIKKKIGRLNRQIDELNAEVDRQTKLLNEVRKDNAKYIKELEEAFEKLGKPGSFSDVCKLIPNRVGTHSCVFLIESAPLIRLKYKINVTSSSAEKRFNIISNLAGDINDMLEELDSLREASKKCN